MFASVLGRHASACRGRQVFLGDDMATKEKLLFVWVLLALAAGFLFHHFWSYALFVLEKTVASGFACLPGLTKTTGEWISIQFLL